MSSGAARPGVALLLPRERPPVRRPAVLPGFPGGEPASIATFAGCCSPAASGLFDLGELELDRGRSAEDQHRHAHAALLVVDFLDHAIEVVERAVDHAHHLAGLEQDLGPGLLDAFLDAVEDGRGFLVADRQRAVGGAADEAHHLRGLLDQVPALDVHARDAALVVGRDLHEHVAREELALRTALLARTHLDHFFGRDQDLAKAILHLRTGDAVTQRLRHRLLEAGVRMHHIPTLDAFRFHQPRVSSHCPRNSCTSHLMTVSNPASSSAMMTTTIITTQVMRMASWRVGQTTLRSSKRDSDRNSRVWRPLRLVMNTATPATTPNTTMPIRAGAGHCASNQ